MKVLVIGNGFDLSHNLETKYSDFMEFVKQFNLVYEINERDNDFMIRSGDFMNFLIKLFRDNNRDISAIVREFREITNENIWIRHFTDVLENKKKIGENWIDFEKEISNIVEWMENIFEKYNMIDELETEYIKGCEERKFNCFRDDLKAKREELKRIDKDNTEDLEDKLIAQYLNDLDSLIRAFEIYLTLYVDSTVQTKQQEDILGLDLKESDAIISFNYTDTYNRLYKNNRVAERNVHFIHGRARLNSGGDNNMIIGIDEHHKGEEQHEKLKYVRFQKYFQRIVKGTDASYKRIFEEPQPEGTYIEVYIFGHSLDVTDKDIIEEIITDEKTKVTVYSYNKEVQKQQVTNLIKIVKKDMLIKSTYDSEPKVKFKLQKGEEES